MSYHAPPPPPPLLLTKRVTAFLHANLSPQLHTAALTTPTGKLLAHASSREPARVLRRQCAVAASLWALHSGSGGRVGRPGSAASSTTAHGSPDTASPGGSGDKDIVAGGSGGGDAGGTGSWRGRPRDLTNHGGEASPTVTVQLENGVTFVMRRLRCGMLFVCIGDNGEQGQQQGHLRRGSGSHPPQQQIAEGSGSGGPSAAPQTEAGAATPTAQAGSPSEGESVLSGGTVGAGTAASQATTVGSSSGAAAGAMKTASSVASFRSLASTAGTVALKRQVEELARWLDEKLGPLTVPEEGIGISTGWDLR